MRYRKLDEHGDYILGGRDHLLTGRQAVGQAIRTRLLLLLGEWWEDPEDGLPLFEQILGTFHGEDTGDIDLIFADRILGTQSVREITHFESKFDAATRGYSVSCTVNTPFGEVGIQVGSEDLVRVKVVV